MKIRVNSENFFITPDLLPSKFNIEQGLDVVQLGIAGALGAQLSPLKKLIREFIYIFLLFQRPRNASFV